MKCVCCDKLLSDFEATRKIVREDNSVYYPDMCNNCFKLSALSSKHNVVERYDLIHEIDIDTDDCFDIENFGEADV